MRAELISTNFQAPKPQPDPHPLLGQSKSINPFTSEPQISEVLEFQIHFLPS